MTEPRPPETEPYEPASCRGCHRPIVKTVIGWMHVDTRGTPTTWLCADNDELAVPDLPSIESVNPPAPEPPPPERRRRPTPIPRRSTVRQGDTSPPTGAWPSLDGKPWWEDGS